MVVGLLKNSPVTDNILANIKTISLVFGIWFFNNSPSFRHMLDNINIMSLGFGGTWLANLLFDL